LAKKQSEKEAMQQIILQTVKNEKPSNVERLTDLVQQKLHLSRQEVVDQILLLQNEGKITLKEPPPQTPTAFINYLQTSQAYWYWTTIILAIATTIIVFTVPEESYPIVYVRYVFGSVFVLWMPGYTFIRALFPTKVPIQTSSTELDNIERIALSIGMSLALVPIVGLLLNYTPFGIRLTPVTLSLLALTLTFATAAIIREHKANLKLETALRVPTK